MLSDVGLWSHLAAAIGYGALAAWLLVRNGAKNASGLLLICAAVLTAIWASAIAFAAASGGQAFFLLSPTETLRNAGWTAFLLSLASGGWRTGEDIRTSRQVATGLMVLYGAQLILFFLPLQYLFYDPIEGMAYLKLAMRIAAAIGMLVLIHNLSVMASPSSRWGIRMMCVGLGAMFGYDLNLYTYAFLTRAFSADLVNMRGVAVLIVLPIILMSARRNRGWRVQFTHTAAFQTLSLAAIGVYLIAMAMAGWGLQVLGGDSGRLLRIALLFAAVVGLGLITVSRRVQGWLRVQIAKRFFAYKYDYRAEWLRFIRTVSVFGEGYGEMRERVIQVIAEIVNSPGGQLFTPGADGTLTAVSNRNWHGGEAQAVPLSHPLVRHLSETGRIADIRNLHRASPIDRVEPPAWMVDDPSVWLLVPLIHLDRLVGVVMLEPARVALHLNWEDYDLLRIVGQQAASYIAEEESLSALADAQQFEEFNRRFAFIMHDIKNLVSQLSLVARNAERHADNPDFRADMVATLKSSVEKMNSLLARLAQHNSGRAADEHAVALAPLVEAVTAIKGRAHPLVVEIAARPVLTGDAQRLEQVIAHLLQNAIDASEPDTPIDVRLDIAENLARLMIEDRGKGMTPAFVRDQLFRPFASTKADGFGIGAYEAREIVREAGGRLEVISRENQGSIFTVYLPMGRPEAGVQETKEGTGA